MDQGTEKLVKKVLAETTIDKDSPMARDEGLEEMIAEDLADERSLTTKPMFGGLAWLLDDKLVCYVCDEGLMVRLGKGNDAWALKIDGIQPMKNGKRNMTGWVWVVEDAYAEDSLRKKLLNAALMFTRKLPAK